MLDFIKNLSLNLRAGGMQAVFIAWFIAIASVGVFGEGETASTALKVLGTGGLFIFLIAAFSRPPSE